jgi:Bacteriophage Sf6, terminase small subunit-like
MGRPSTYRPEVADEICDLIADGVPLYKVCKSGDYPHLSTIYKWLENEPTFAEKYARAKERLADFRADEIIEIADTCEDANVARLRVDARKWAAAKLMPRRYGDRITHEGTDGGPVRLICEWKTKPEKDPQPGD